ncbi:MAG: hypothetical protein CUN55_09495, partial [Phototrophicales bacterium]
KKLIDAQLVMEQSANIFTFRHALTQQAIYSQLLIRERLVLHQQIADALESIYIETKPFSLISDLATHYFEAGNWDKASKYCKQAGEQARQYGSPHIAYRYFSQTLVAIQEQGLDPDIEVLRARGHANESLGRFDAAHLDFENAYKEAVQHNQDSLVCLCLLDLGFLWTGRDFRKAGDYFQQAIAIAHDLNHPATLASTLNRVGNWHANRENYGDALILHKEALSIFEKCGDIAGLASTFDLLGVTNLMAGNIIEYIANLQQAERLFRKLGNQTGLSSCLSQLSMCGGSYMMEAVYTPKVALQDCIHYGDEALNIALEIESRPRQAAAMMYFGLALGARGKYQRALDLGRQCLDIATDIEHKLWETSAHMLLGKLHLDLLILTSAQQHLEQAVVLAKQTTSTFLINATSGFLAQTYVALNNLSQAESVLNDASLLTGLDLEAAPQSLAQRILQLANIECILANGQGDQAIQRLETLIAHANKENVEDIVPRLSLMQAQALIANQQYQPAIQLLEKAVDMMKDDELSGLSWRISATLGKAYLLSGQREDAIDTCNNARQQIERLASQLYETFLRDSFAQMAQSLIPQPTKLTPRQAAKRTFGGLTEREREIAVLVAEGKSNREIAEKLVLSKRTVDAHISNILNKLGFSSRTQIAHWVAGKKLG